MRDTGVRRRGCDGQHGAARQGTAQHSTAQLPEEAKETGGSRRTGVAQSSHASSASGSGSASTLRLLPHLRQNTALSMKWLPQWAHCTGSLVSDTSSCGWAAMVWCVSVLAIMSRAAPSRRLSICGRRLVRCGGVRWVRIDRARAKARWTLRAFFTEEKLFLKSFCAHFLKNKWAEFSQKCTVLDLLDQNILKMHASAPSQPRR